MCGGWKGRQRPDSLGLYQVPRGGLCRKSFKEDSLSCCAGRNTRAEPGTPVRGSGGGPGVKRWGWSVWGVEAKCTGWRAALERKSTRLSRPGAGGDRRRAGGF